MIDFFKIKKARQVISLFLALILSLIVNYFLADTDVFLIPLTTLYVMQTSIGNSFYQGMKKLGWVLLIIILASLSVYSMQLFYAMASDIVLGGAIGIIANLILLPVKPATEFREDILPLIQAFSDYFSKVMDQVLQSSTTPFDNATLENALLEMPDWVYKRGFNHVLQTGYRFFLMQLEKMSDILLSMHHLSRYQYDKELIAKIRPVLLQCADSVNAFFSSIITVLELKKLSEEPADPENELAELQKQFFTIVPASLELLDMRRDYVYLAAFIYDLKDLRNILVKMGESLR